MQLKARLEEIDGTPRAVCRQFGELEVTDLLNDGRTAKLNLSLLDPAVKQVIPGKRLLSVTYGPFLVFRGRIGRPKFDYQQGSVEINCLDAKLALMNHYHRYGDIVVDYGYPLDGLGYRQLVESSIPIEPQLDRDIPGNGILWGIDDTTLQGPKPTTDPPAPGDGLWRRVERGANVWETLQNASQIVGAPDFRLRPVDREHQGVSGEPPAGFFCELDTFDRLGQDWSNVVKFQHNFGQRNAENVIHEPDFTMVRNYWVQVYPGGERNRDDSARRALSHNEQSWLDYGIMGGWESSGQRDKQTVLQAKADAWVKAYAYPPDFFQVMPATDGPNVPAYMEDYQVGDNITAQAKKGYCSIDLVGRIIGVTLKQQGANGSTKAEIDCVPTIDPDLGNDDQG